MNYDKIINATYDWLSLEKATWFLLFFWLSLPVLFLVPIAIESGAFYYKVNFIVEIIYSIMYLAVLLGFMLLTCSCLAKKKFKVKDVSVTRFFDTIFIVFIEFWHVFIWNLHKSYRFTQLLLVAGIPLLMFYSSIVESLFIEVALNLFLICYLFIVIYNIVRLSFSITIFYNKDVSLIKAVEESWSLTHNKFWQTLFSYVSNISTVFVIFIIVSVILGALSNLMLANYFTLALSYKISLTFASFFALAPALIGYHFGFIETYAQLNKDHVTHKRIKRLLAKKVLHSSKKKFIKKKIVKTAKKTTKKKVAKKVKKKVVKKKTIKKKGKKK